MGGEIGRLPRIARHLERLHLANSHHSQGNALAHLGGGTDELATLVEIEHAAAESDSTKKQKKSSAHDTPFKARPSLWGVG